MDREAWRRLEGFIDEALDLDEAGRQELLDRVGAQDPALRREIEAVLANEAAARGLLERPLEERAPALLGAIATEDRSWEGLHLEGHAVGPYRLIRELGRGGMGVVFLAERADGQFEQRVALKLVRRGISTSEILRRFRAERQIQARLQHPNIARLLDGGADEAGQPFFAMEFVEGTALGAYCDQAKLTVAQRLRLFLQVCDAVEYAHRNLVVHRDIKPSNVLVTPDGQAKLLDFGIAKLLDPTTGDGTVTVGDSRPLTPRYAAPELLLGEPVTTVTDVYSLGVVLYELLCGRHPHRLQDGSADALRRLFLQKVEAEPLSSAVHRSDHVDGGEPQAIAEARGVGAEVLVRQLRGDLDNIVGMATRREPGRRYSSVGALAADVRSFLEGRPVSARGESAAYRASKFVARHRVAVGAAVLVAASLVAGVVGTVWQARRAVEQARKAEEVKRFVFGLFQLSDPDAAKGKEITARELLERGARRIESDLADQPDVQAEMLLFVGNIYHRLGMNPESRPFIEKALALRRQHFAEDSLEVAEAEVAMGSVHFALGELVPAESLCERALSKRARKLGEAHPDTAVARCFLGRVRLEKGEHEKAHQALLQATADLRRHAPSTDANLAVSLNALGLVLQSKGDLDGAETAYREALELRRKLHGEEHSAVSASLSNLAAVMQDRGKVREATVQYRRLLALDRRLLGDAHDKVALDLNFLGVALVASGELTEAERLLRESLVIYGRAPKGSPLRAMALHNLSRALRRQGKLAEAEASSREALALAAGTLGDEHTHVANVRVGLASILSDRREFEEAERLALGALATQRKQLPADHPRIADALVALGRVHLAAGRPGDAEQPLEEALQLRGRRFGEGDWRTAEAHLEMAECLAGSGRGAEALRHLAAAAGLERAFGREHPLAVRAAALRHRVEQRSVRAGR